MWSRRGNCELGWGWGVAEIIIIAFAAAAATTITLHRRYTTVTWITTKPGG